MRITTGMLNESARKAGLPINRSTLLDHLNQKETTDIWGNVQKTNGVNAVKKSEYQKMEKAANALRDSAELLNAENTDLYKNAKAKNDTSELVKHIETFVSGYNDLLSALSKGTTSLDSYYKMMLQDIPAEVGEELGNMGIQQSKDGKLKVEAEKLKTADADSLEKLFGSSSILTSKVAFLAERVESNAKASQDSVGTTYGYKGTAIDMFSDGKYNFKA